MKARHIISISALVVALSTSLHAQEKKTPKIPLSGKNNTVVQSEESYFYGLSLSNQNMHFDYLKNFSQGSDNNSQSIGGTSTSSVTSPTFGLGYQFKEYYSDGSEAFFRMQTEIGKYSHLLSKTFIHDMSFNPEYPDILPPSLPVEPPIEDEIDNGNEEYIIQPILPPTVDPIISDPILDEPIVEDPIFGEGDKGGELTDPCLSELNIDICNEDDFGINLPGFPGDGGNPDPVIEEPTIDEPELGDACIIDSSSPECDYIGWRPIDPCFDQLGNYTCGDIITDPLPEEPTIETPVVDEPFPNDPYEPYDPCIEFPTLDSCLSNPGNDFEPVYYNADIMVSQSDRTYSQIISQYTEDNYSGNTYSPDRVTPGFIQTSDGQIVAYDGYSQTLITYDQFQDACRNAAVADNECKISWDFYMGGGTDISSASEIDSDQSSTMSAMTQSKSPIAMAIEPVRTTVDVDVDIYLSHSFQVGLSHRDWNGWSAYGIIGGSIGKLEIDIKNNRGMHYNNSGILLIGEVGLGVEKEVKPGMTIYGEYKYGRALDDVFGRVSDGMITEDMGAKIEYDRVQVGMRYKF